MKSRSDKYRIELKWRFRQMGLVLVFSPSHRNFNYLMDNNKGWAWLCTVTDGGRLMVGWACECCTCPGSFRPLSFAPSLLFLPAFL